MVFYVIKFNDDVLLHDEVDDGLHRDEVDSNHLRDDDLCDQFQSLVDSTVVVGKSLEVKPLVYLHSS